MQACKSSTPAYNPIIPVSMQAYYPSTAAHNHLCIPPIPPAGTPPPTPTAADLIASLQHPENLSDDELLKRTLNAQSALFKWQTEYFENDRDIRRATTGLFNKIDEPRALQLQDPEEYERNRNKADDDAMKTHETSSRGRKLTKTANASYSQPATQPIPKTRKPKATTSKKPQPPNVTTSKTPKPKTAKPKTSQAPKPTASAPPKPKTTRSKTPQAAKPAKPTTTTAPSKPSNLPLAIPKDLLINMNGPQPAQTTGKRTRQPRKIFDAPPPPTAATVTNKTRAATPSIPTKKRARTAEVDDEDSAPAAPPPPKKRAVKKEKEKEEEKEKEASVGPATRSKKGEVMRAVWAKRQAEGRNGRHGGAPKSVTVEKARARGGADGGM